MKRLPNNNGQTTIDLTLSLIILFILVIGIFRLFIWFNKSLVMRQEAYRDTRTLATEAVPFPEGYTKFYPPEKRPKLDLFNAVPKTEEK